MKTIIVLLISCTFSLMAENTYSQTTVITVNAENITVDNAIKKIENSSDYYFIFTESVHGKLRKRINLPAKNKPINEVIDDVLKTAGLSYRIVDKQVIVFDKKSAKTAEVAATLLASNNTSTETQKASTKRISGRITDEQGEPVIGASIVEKDKLTNGTVSDIDGNFILTVNDNAIIKVSFLGYDDQEINVSGRQLFQIKLQERARLIDEIVVVGYGQQKKASVVGSISTTSSKELSHNGGITNVGQALTGLLPGLTTIQTTGQPGSDDPLIYIRGQGTWNGGQPLILVDGVDRKMNDLDITEIDNISVLKDASATAVYGVKGANGVILITTKRGVKGKPNLSFSANSTLKYPSRLMPKLDAYDTYMVRNAAIEHELPLYESSWADYIPLEIVKRYRNQQALKYPEAYPNVDWQRETIKDYAMDHRVSLNASGGTDFAKYFSLISYNKQGDLLKIRDNGKGYQPGFDYNKLNFRTNFDFAITKKTNLKLNLSGVFSETKGSHLLSQYILSAQYALPADAFLPQYADGRWGKSLNGSSRMANSAALMANYGYTTTYQTDLTTDLGITQQLDFITPGLSATANLSFDNYFQSAKSINDWDANFPTKFIDPAIEDMPEGGDPSKYIIIDPLTGTNQFPWVMNPWTLQAENASTALYRRLYYQMQLNYERAFGKHNVAATGVFTREQSASGDEFQHFREDWVARLTYNYSLKYFLELNGAYNGSEQFGPKYRFGFFPSAAIGWMISEEKFMKNISWLDKLKLRYSLGLIGDDGGLDRTYRWLYSSIWEYNGRMTLIDENIPNTNQEELKSPYIIYKEATVGNPNIHWEKARKSNLGLELAVLKNMLSLNLDLFDERRTDILLLGKQRVLPPYYGTDAPTANVGIVDKKGYEIELRFNKNISDFYIWTTASMTHVKDKIIYKEEPELKDPHSKEAGFSIDQIKSMMGTGYMQTWDDVYANAPLSSNDRMKLPGNSFLIDFDGNGVLEYDKDGVPYGYSTRPQNNYNLSFGTEYKGLSLMLQFYGVNNVSRWVSFENFVSNINIAYEHTLDHWSKDNPNASSFLPRWNTQDGQPSAQYFVFDGSYVRLKTVEIAYNFTKGFVKKIGVSSLRVFMNGNNLLFWSKMPDDREQGGDRFGAYPTTRRVNIGIDVNF